MVLLTLVCPPSSTVSAQYIIWVRREEGGSEGEDVEKMRKERREGQEEEEETKRGRQG